MTWATKQMVQLHISAVVHTLLTVLGAPVFQAPQVLLKALLENFPGKTTREQSQHDEGSRAVQHMAFCTWAGRIACTSFADSSEKAWPQTRWPLSCTGTFPLSHEAITTLSLPVQFQAYTVCLLHKQLHFEPYRLHALGPENPAQGEAQEASVTLQGGWGLGCLVGLVGGFVGWFLFGAF